VARARALHAGDAEALLAEHAVAASAFLAAPGIPL
jgi:hypothetical protein